MKATVVARRYARALADEAGRKDPSRLEKVASELALAAEAIHDDPAVLKFFLNPAVPPHSKEQAIDAVAKALKAAEPLRNFLRLLVRNRRLRDLPAIAAVFETIKDDRLGFVAVEATTAIELRPAEARKFKESLETMTGRKVRLSLRVDPSVLGGARARIGSQVYDGTLRRHLAALRERLTGAL